MNALTNVNKFIVNVTDNLSSKCNTFESLKQHLISVVVRKGER